MKHRGGFWKYFADYKFNSLFFRNLLLLLGLIMIPLLGAVMISYYAYGDMQKEEQRTASEKIASDLYSDLKRIFGEAEMELIYFGMNSDVELYLYDEDLNQYNYKVGTIQKLIRMPVIAKNYVDSVWIYSFKNDKVITPQGVANYENFEERAATDAFLKQNRRKGLMLSANENNFYPRITMFQEIRYGKKRNGVIAMAFDAESLLEELNVPENVRLYLTDGETVFLSDEKGMIGRPVKEIEEYGSLIHGGSVIGEAFITSSGMAEKFPLEVITRTDIDDMQSQLTAVRTMMLTFLAVMTLITLGILVAVSFRLFQPIDRILDSIEESHKVLMGEEELFEDKDELGYILSSVRKTVMAKQDVEEKLAERIRLLKKAQAVALQSQINPHFLNNTLETINWSAIELLGGRNEISRMAGALSRMLRMTLENSDTVVPISMEIQHCRYYLEIQKLRYEDKFDVLWEIPPEVEQCRIIRIVLQPLVENAIYHGVKPLTNKGQIRISGRILEDTVELAVRDNGLGMTAGELENLRRNMDSDTIRESLHIGVTNVNQRLRLYFGEDYGLLVESREGEGTVVTVRIPRIEEEAYEKKTGGNGDGFGTDSDGRMRAGQDQRIHGESPARRRGDV